MTRVAPVSLTSAALALLLVGLSGGWWPVAAQIEAPTTWTGQVFGARPGVDPLAPSRLLTFTVDLLGGYDSNQTPAGAATPDGALYTGLPSGDVGAVSATLRYRAGSEDRYFEATGRSRGSRSASLNEQLVGGIARASAFTRAGPRHGISGDVEFGFEPTYLFNAFGPVVAQLDGSVVASLNPIMGVTEQQWLNSAATAGVYRDWTLRQRTDVAVHASYREPVKGLGFESRSQSGTIRHSWGFSRRSALDLVYRLDDDVQQLAGAEQRLRQHAAELELSTERQLSATRSIRFSIGGGALAGRTRSSLAGDDVDLWSPIASASTRLDLSRSWSLDLDVRRSVTILRDITPEPFATGAAGLELTGNLSPRAQVQLRGAYSRGASEWTGSGSFDSTVATAQVQFALARSCALFAGYTYYDHRIRDVRTFHPGFPNSYAHQSIRGGLTLWLPLFDRH